MAERLDDLSGLLASIGLRNSPRHPPRDIYVRDLRLGSGIKVPTREFAEEEGDVDAPVERRPASGEAGPSSF